jgi:DNA repair photolyase
MSTETMNGKPVFYVPATKSVLNFESGFEHKKLCDGLTFTAGTACAYSCNYCYVESMMFRNPHLKPVKAAGLTYEQAVIRRRGAVGALYQCLTDTRGNPKYKTPEDTRVLYMSPLVDVAANNELAQETIEACRIILQTTNWQIRMLSKSPLIVNIAKTLEAHKDRIIYGLSTGIHDDKLGKVIEQGAPGITARIKAMHTLQNHGFRTFGMLCPTLPTKDYTSMAETLAEEIRADKCEHVWGEVMNVRGRSFDRVETAMKNAGYDKLAGFYRSVMEDKSGAWEQYARATFEAHTKAIPADKLRFLQYVTKKTESWWQSRERDGAICL